MISKTNVNIGEFHEIRYFFTNTSCILRFLFAEIRDKFCTVIDCSK